MADGKLALRSRGFLSFLATQFLGAFNDNVYRFTLIGLIVATFADDAPARGRWYSLAQALFALPFVVFAALAGSLADRVSKSRLIVLAKLAEVVVMAAGVLAFASGNFVFLLVVLVAMSAQSTFFGPGKYGYLAETVAERDLARANGLVQMTTMVAIVAGQAVGGALYDTFEGRLAFAAVVMVAIAVLGWITSMGVPAVSAARPSSRLALNPFPELLATWRSVRADVTLLYTVLGIGHFFLLSALLQIDLFDYGVAVLALSKTSAGIFVATTVLGIGAGSLLAARWSDGKVELGLVPLGALTMSLGVLGIAYAVPVPLPLPAVLAALLEGTLPGALLTGGLWLPFAVTFLMGAAGGLFIVPLWALLQLHAPASEKGRFLAFGNAVSFVGIALSALFLWLPREFELSFRAQFLAIAVLSLAGTAVSVRLLPYAFVRFLAWLLVHTFYRVRVLHADRLPAHGPALLLVNHVSWVDALVLSASSRRRGLHFLMYRQYYEWWPLHWLFKLVGCIPVASGDPKGVVLDSLEKAGRYLDEGRLVVVFAEGAVTRLGHMLAFRSGYRRILGDRDVPVLPVYLGGLWGSIFSHAGGRLLWKLPRAFPYPVTVAIGAPLASSAEPHEVRAAIHELAVECWDSNRADRLPLHVTLLRERRRSFRAALHEPGVASLSPARLLARSLLVARTLAGRLGPARRVGLLVAPGQDAPLAALALLFAGRVPVLLDPSAPASELLRLIRLTGLDSVIVGRGVALPPALDPALALVALADCVAAHTPAQERAQLLRCCLLPWRLVARDLPGTRQRDVASPAAVLFTSGVTSRARAVVLSHFNVLSNVEGLQQVLDCDGADGVLGLLPPSQAFGWVMTLWYPLLSGLRVGYHDPADGRAVGRFTERHRLTVLPAAPYLLESLLREVRPDSFGGLRVVFSGLQRLPARLAIDFAHTFGIEPREVYTATECTAVVALNSGNVREFGVYQRGTHRGTAGHPLPGLSVSVLDIETRRLLPHGREGLVAIRGPSVMGGYLGDVEASADVLRREGLVTGDVGHLDEDGFITLTDRLGRSSLIDGTRVPHRLVEEAIARCRRGEGDGEREILVLGRRDGAGRERLLVFHEDAALDPGRVVTSLRAQGLAEACLPRVEDFFALDALPRTPLGLVDVRTLRAALAPAGELEGEVPERDEPTNGEPGAGEDDEGEPDEPELGEGDEGGGWDEWRRAPPVWRP